MSVHHFETEGTVSAPAHRVFEYVDDHANVSYHMNEPSWKMAGARMRTELDEGRGQRVGSHIGMSGRVLGIDLSLDEAVTERVPPAKKVWETVGTPKLLVIGAYRMGFDITPHADASRLRVFIDYSLPERPPARWLGRLFGRFYAKWCTTQMVVGAQRHFEEHRNANSPGA